MGELGKAIEETNELIEFVKFIEKIDDNHKKQRSRLLFTLHSIILEETESLSIGNFMSYYNSVIAYDYQPMDCIDHLMDSVVTPPNMGDQLKRDILNVICHDFIINFEQIVNNEIDKPSPDMHDKRHESYPEFSKMAFDVLYLWFNVPKTFEKTLVDYLISELKQVMINEIDGAVIH